MHYLPLISILLSGVCALALTPVVRWLAVRLGAMDLPGGRRVHLISTPRLGGVAMVSGYILAMLFFGFSLRNQISTFKDWIPFIVGPLCASFLGVLDDFFSLGSKRKLFAQLVLGTIVALLGLRIHSISFGLGEVYLRGFEIPLTALWIAFVMNAVNLIDGIDGLAAGTSVISFLAIAGLGFMVGNTFTATVALIAAAASLAFLRFNFSRKKIFMGDSGSLFLGFLIATLPLTLSKNGFPLPIYVVLFCITLPLTDTILAIVRRTLRSLDMSWEPFPREFKTKPRFLAVMKDILTADGDHIHHRLLYKGYTPKKAVLVLYAFSFLTCMLSLVLMLLPAELAWFVTFFSVFVIWQLILLLDYSEFLPKEVRRETALSNWKEALGNRSSIMNEVASNRKSARRAS